MLPSIRHLLGSDIAPGPGPGGPSSDIPPSHAHTHTPSYPEHTHSHHHMHNYPYQDRPHPSSSLQNGHRHEREQEPVSLPDRTCHPPKQPPPPTYYRTQQQPHEQQHPYHPQSQQTTLYQQQHRTHYQAHVHAQEQGPAWNSQRPFGLSEDRPQPKMTMTDDLPPESTPRPRSGSHSPVGLGLSSDNPADFRRDPFHSHHHSRPPSTAQPPLQPPSGSTFSYRPQHPRASPLDPSLSSSSSSASPSPSISTATAASTPLTADAIAAVTTSTAAATISDARMRYVPAHTKDQGHGHSHSHGHSHGQGQGRPRELAQEDHIQESHGRRYSDPVHSPAGLVQSASRESLHRHSAASIQVQAHPSSSYNGGQLMETSSRVTLLSSVYHPTADDQVDPRHQSRPPLQANSRRQAYSSSPPHLVHSHATHRMSYHSSASPPHYPQMTHRSNQEPSSYSPYPAPSPRTSSPSYGHVKGLLTSEQDYRPQHQHQHPHQHEHQPQHQHQQPLQHEQLQRHAHGRIGLDLTNQGQSSRYGSCSPLEPYPRPEPIQKSSSPSQQSTWSDRLHPRKDSATRLAQLDHFPLQHPVQQHPVQHHAQPHQQDDRLKVDSSLTSHRQGRRHGSHSPPHSTPPHSGQSPHHPHPQPHPTLQQQHPPPLYDLVRESDQSFSHPSHPTSLHAPPPHSSTSTHPGHFQPYQPHRQRFATAPGGPVQHVLQGDRMDRPQVSPHHPALSSSQQQHPSHPHPQEHHRSFPSTEDEHALQIDPSLQANPYYAHQRLAQHPQHHQRPQHSGPLQTTVRHPPVAMTGMHVRNEGGSRVEDHAYGHPSHASRTSPKTPTRRGPYLSRQRALLAGLETSSPSSRYQCQYCHKRFSRPSSLRIHTYSHTGERPFKCSEEGCGRQFSVQSNMRRHLRVHRLGRMRSEFDPEMDDE